ncbi:DUF4124 domain-containing protein [Rubrivivax sp. JA1026]|uniref:DUF4124 domain-containing protein n=1 Tax=Rubrivivax sp. JA1026 TaxID=2710888 RepID=UPI0013E92EEF|nr:DUF4124 domain-containing protein [Rubrivivax sp. JA1026]
MMLAGHAPSSRAVEASLVALLGLLLCADTVDAQSLHRCKDADGGTVMTDRPCNPPPNQTRTESTPQSRPAPRGISEADRRAFLEKFDSGVSDAIQKEAQRTPKIVLPSVDGKTASSRMQFSECQRSVRALLLSVEGQYRTAPVIVSADVTVHRICQPGGSVLVACNATDHVLTVIPSKDDPRC